MLILTRQTGQSLKIGDDVTVTILTVRGTQVRIGVEAPKNVTVHRNEIYERIQRGDGGWRRPEPKLQREPTQRTGLPPSKPA